jgi:hypothetical protein
MVDGLSELFGVEDGSATVGRAGLAGFLYLEMVDASFSFDGVIAAFAITNNFIIIVLGLSVGAMFVRSMTIFLVEQAVKLDDLFAANAPLGGVVPDGSG